MTSTHSQSPLVTPSPIVTRSSAANQSRPRTSTDPLLIRLLSDSDELDSERLRALYDNVDRFAGRGGDHRPRLSIEQCLADEGLVDPWTIARAYSSHYLLPLYEPEDDQFGELDPRVAALLPVEFCVRNRIVPLVDEGDTLQIAIESPDAMLLSDDIRFHTGRQMRPMFTATPIISGATLHLYGLSAASDDGPVRFEDLGRFDDTESARRRNNDRTGNGSTAGPLERLIERATTLRAEDVHLQIIGDRCDVRFRIDGMLVSSDERCDADAMTEALDAVTRWADGPSTDSATAGVRVHRCDVAGGHSWLLQIARQSAKATPLSDLPMDDPDRGDLIRGLSAPRGLVLVAGPTDSGKSETIYSCLDHLKSPSLNVFTIERSVRYEIPGVNQTIVDDEDYFGTAHHMQSVLEQNPDVLMVHQIRDAATASLCVQSAASGRRVIAGVPSLDACGVVRYLQSLGVNDFQIDGVIRAVVAQRRVRLLCDCKRPVTLPEEASRRLEMTAQDRVYGPTGCDRCLGTGYHGRTTVYDVLRLNQRDADSVTCQCSRPRGGLRAAMFRLVKRGQTSLDEVRRVL